MKYAVMKENSQQLSRKLFFTMVSRVIRDELVEEKGKV